MPMEIDPEKMSPMPGQMVIQIVEILGGMTPGGIFIPGTTQDHMGKDTAYGRVLKKGGPPTHRIVRDEKGVGSVVECAPWPESYRELVKEGDVVVVPRDVNLAFFFGEDRYAIVLEEEVIVSIPGSEFDASKFSVVPWRPGNLVPPPQ